MTSPAQAVRDHECPPSVFEVRTSSALGRHALASRALPRGSLVLQETVVALERARTAPNFVSEVCDNCLVASMALQPCSACRGRWYCSSSCQQNAWEAFLPKPTLRRCSTFTVWRAR
eukprot:m.197196 g.197196  ORF g.197196 m.197196 type:complete len:117 (-) comp10642_c0_seq3:1360-1710(-)